MCCLPRRYFVLLWNLLGVAYGRCVPKTFLQRSLQWISPLVRVSRINLSMASCISRRFMRDVPPLVSMQNSICSRGSSREYLLVSRCRLSLSQNLWGRMLKAKDRAYRAASSVRRSGNTCGSRRSRNQEAYVSLASCHTGGRGL